ncbi:hypothetical protein BK004_00520 [bacterium CG10_46_32]|nr:MAG: hypothetical protein BK004_00520 [bacterium CG10_46_32]PIR56495.1 MAG: hypothetical protein COU73_00515 [Parcubacteria group bacterium CG10_big_fil_rev_8_21_14_0_10_46_32]
MKKITIAALAALLITPLALSISVSAATTDFTANAQITVTAVTIDATTGAVVDMFIANSSTAESWSMNSGAFSVTNPGSFSVGSSDSAVRAFQINLSGTQVSCAGNTTPGTSTITLPTTAGTYTVVPRSNECGGGGNVSTGGGGGDGGSSSQNNSQTTDETTTTPPATTTPTTSTPVVSGDTNLANVKSEASSIATKTRAEVAAAAGKAIDTIKEGEYNTSIVGKVVATQSSVSIAVREKILTFVTYGSPTTDSLGAGERGGVVNSFKEAFGRLPESDTDWEDVVKIANGRWPGQTDTAREATAEANFKAIYKRASVRSNAHDDAAVVVMAYGLRPRDRNLNSEKAAIKSYEAIFKRTPQTATAWDAVRAIAYSGATR